MNHAPASVTGTINYLAQMSERPAFHAQDSTRDNLVIDGRRMSIRDARGLEPAPSLDREGFALVRHEGPGIDVEDAAAVEQHYLPAVARLLQEHTGAAEILMMPRAVLRFGERSRRHRTLVNSHPARFAHVDYTEKSAPGLLAGALAHHAYTAAQIEGRRYAGFNVWRVLSPPPQDVPLAICDARSVSLHDLVAGDAVFDAPGVPEFAFEAYLLRHNQAHRWVYYRDMHPEEVLIFKAFDTDSTAAVRVPHVAFDDPGCPPDVTPRASIEVRGFALF
jgi:hypothetical protein